MVEQVEIKTEEATAEKPEVVQTPTTEARPEWLPEKFGSAEDLAKAYSELETKQGQKTEVTPEATTESNDSLEIDKAADDAVESAGLNMVDLQSEYDTSGTLNDESFAALEKAGISKDYVDAFIAGQEAIANNIGMDSVILPLCIVPIQLITFKPVGIPISILLIAKKPLIAFERPTVNM